MIDDSGNACQSFVNAPPVNLPPIVLASTSRYRCALLGRLGIKFDTASPQVDEAPLPNERAHHLARRLAAAKAADIARRRPDAVVIGSDQVAVLGDRILGKPGTLANARAQLERACGRDVAFLTAVSVHSPDAVASHLDITKVTFRDLTGAQIERYVAAEQPLDCAGSFKAEGLGIALFAQIEARDPTGLIGLPLIWLAEALRQLGYRVP